MKMGLLNRVMVFALLIMIITSLGFVLVYNKSTTLRFIYPLLHPKPRNLEFSIKPCDQNVSAYDNNKMGVRDISWSDNTLTVKTYISTFCSGEEIVSPNYYVKDSNLTLEYTSIKGTIFTKCLCTKELNFIIHNLPKKDYKVILSGLLI
jgi:hypothetical protein